MTFSSHSSIIGWESNWLRIFGCMTVLRSSGESYNEYPRAVQDVPQWQKDTSRVAGNTVNRGRGEQEEKREWRENVQGSRKREEFHWGENVRRGEEFSPAARFSHATIRQRNKYSLPQVCYRRSRARDRRGVWRNRAAPTVARSGDDPNWFRIAVPFAPWWSLRCLKVKRRTYASGCIIWRLWKFNYTVLLPPFSCSWSPFHCLVIVDFMRRQSGRNREIPAWR